MPGNLGFREEPKFIVYTSGASGAFGWGSFPDEKMTARALFLKKK